jgi:hypothetical protein
MYPHVRVTKGLLKIQPLLLALVSPTRSSVEHDVSPTQSVRPPGERLHELPACTHQLDERLQSCLGRLVPYRYSLRRRTSRQDSSRGHGEDLAQCGTLQSPDLRLSQNMLRHSAALAAAA